MDGTWEATGLTGAYMVQALAYDATFLPAQVTAQAAQTGINFVRKDTVAPVRYGVSGRVAGPDGVGISNVEITLNGPTLYKAYTNSAGEWNVVNLAGAYLVTASLGVATFLPAGVTVTTAQLNVNFTRQSTRAEYYETAKVEGWLLKSQQTNGLVTNTNSTFVSTYDQGLAALAFMATGNIARAERIFDYFDNRRTSELEAGPGGFYQFRDAVTGVTSGQRWMGDNAWLLIALNHYAARVNPTRYGGLQTGLTTWIRSLQKQDGSLLAGYQASGSAYYTGGTEGFLDGYFAVSGYDSFHSNLLRFMRLNTWKASEQVLYNAPLNSTSPYRYALDCFAWAYCMIDNFPASVLTSANRFVNAQTATLNGATVLGYAPDPDRDVVWIEGTCQMVVAYQLAGDTAAANLYLREMRKMLTLEVASPGVLGFPYAANRVTGYGTDLFWVGVDNVNAVSSAAWYLYGALEFNPFSEGRGKNVPSADRFW
jgi:hypothetical protein